MWELDELEGVADLEEGALLLLAPREPVTMKTNAKFERNYTSLEELGKGKFGVVKKCFAKDSPDTYLAAKFIRKTASSKKEVVREVHMMNFLHHKRLIQLHDAFETPREMIVIMELVTGGELFEKVVEEDNLTERQVIRYMKQVLFGLQHMHHKHMVHLDLKPENILCLGGGKPGYEEIKLIDFGMTRILVEGEQESAMCGTPEFVAPEVINFEPITLAADMWSIGVITYVLLSGLSPFMGDDDNETLENVTLGEYDYEDEDGVFDNLSKDVKDFIDACLVLDPRKRIDVDRALTHEWIQNEGSEKKLNTSNLKKFIARRRWQRTMNTIKAVSRLAGGLNLKGGGLNLGGKDFLAKVKKQQEVEDEEEMEAQAIEDEKRRKEEKKRAEEKERKEKEEKRKAEGKRKAEEKREKEEKERREKEEKKKAEEEKRKAEEKEKREEEARRKKAEMKERQKKEEERKGKEEEAKQRQEEAAKKKEEMKKRQAEEKRRKDDEAKEQAEKTAKEEEAKKAEERKLKRDQERKRLKEERLRKEEEDKLRKEDEEQGLKNEAEEKQREKEEDILQKEEEDRLKKEESKQQPIDENENIIETKNNLNGTSMPVIQLNSGQEITMKIQANPNLMKKVYGLNSRSRNDNGSNSPASLRKSPIPAGNVKNRAAAFQTGDAYWKNKR